LGKGDIGQSMANLVLSGDLVEVLGQAEHAEVSDDHG
jgi:hypothetical protein